MSTQGYEIDARKKQNWLRLVLLAILPQGIANKRLTALEEYSGTTIGFIRGWWGVFHQAYFEQATYAFQAFGKYANLAMAGVILFCFATAPVWSATFVLLLVVLMLFIIRDAYMYGREAYRSDGITDAAVALIFLLAAETLTMQWLPSLAMPKDVFFKGAAACLPLLWMVRMLSRPRPEPDPNTPLWPGMEPERIYWKMVRLNVIWIHMFYFSIMMFVADGPSYIDDARGFLPGFMFSTWIMVQGNRLVRRNFVEQLTTDPRQLRLSRMVETLPQGLKKNDPQYWWYIALEGLLFFMGAANIGVELWNWLHGESPAGWWRIGTALIAFVISVAAWRNVKAANRAAVAAIRAYL